MTPECYYPGCMCYARWIPYLKVRPPMPAPESAMRKVRFPFGVCDMHVRFVTLHMLMTPEVIQLENEAAQKAGELQPDFNRTTLCFEALPAEG